MSGALKSANQELLRQLLRGQETVEASLQRLTSGQAPKCVTWRLSDADRKENLLKRRVTPSRTETTPVTSVPDPSSLPRPPLKLCEASSKNDDAVNEVGVPTNGLLESEGNRRRTRGKRSIDEVAEDDDKGIRSILTRSGVQRRSTPSSVQFDKAGDPMHRSGSAGAAPEPKVTPASSLLGYDWIAGMVENCGKMNALEQSAEYFERLGQFRRENKEACVAREFRHETFIEDVVNTLKPGERVTIPPRPGQLTVDQIMDARDCEEPVFAYTVNERLFPIPINPETENRGPTSSDSPHIMKVSIPSYRLLDSPSRLHPHRRRSIDEADTFSLVGHCQVGFHPGPLTKPTRAHPADLPSSSSKEGDCRRRPAQPRCEAEAVEQLRRSARPKPKIPADLRAPSNPRVIEAMLSRKEMRSEFEPSARGVPNPRRPR